MTALRSAPENGVALAGWERVCIAAVGAGNLLLAGFMLIEPSAVVTARWTWVTSVLLVVASGGCLFWAAHPGSRRAYAVAGATSSTAYLSRSAFATLTLIDGAQHPWTVATAVGVWLLMTVLVLLAWRRLDTWDDRLKAGSVAVWTS